MSTSTENAELDSCVRPRAAVIAWLDDVLYPAHMYRTGACRVGARLLRRLIGVDADEQLTASYLPGREEHAVRQVLERYAGTSDERLVRKVAEAMAVHSPQVAPYEDALETFGILQALGVPLWLLGEGPPRAQRLIAERLGANRLFRGVAYCDPCQDHYEWQDSLMLLELAAEAAADKTALVCADPVRVAAMAQQGRRVFHLHRQPNSAAMPTPHANIIPMLNLYDLPEALGLVNWNAR